MNKKFLIIGITCTILGFLSKVIREYIYDNNVNDYGVFGSLPSFFYIVGLIFLIIAIFKVNIENRGIGLIVCVTLGALVYEVEQLFSSRVFDIKDVIATVVGAIISLILYKHILRRS